MVRKKGSVAELTQAPVMRNDEDTIDNVLELLAQPVPVDKVKELFLEKYGSLLDTGTSRLTRWLRKLPNISILPPTKKGRCQDAVHSDFLSYLTITSKLVKLYGETGINEWPSSRVDIESDVAKLSSTCDILLPSWERLEKRWLADGCCTLSSEGDIVWNEEATIKFLARYKYFIEKHCQGSSNSTVVLKGNLLKEASNVDTEQITPTLVQTENDLKKAFVKDKEWKLVTLNFDYSGGEMALLEVMVASECYVVDCLALGTSCIWKHLQFRFEDCNVLKFVHNLYPLMSVLHSAGIPLANIRGFFDSQLAMEHLTGNPLTEWNDMLTRFGQPMNKLREAHRSSFTSRPLSKDAIRDAGTRVKLTAKIYSDLVGELGQDFDKILKASDDRARQERRIMTFDCNTYSLISKELINMFKPDAMMHMPRLVVSDEVHDLLKLLPKNTQEEILEMGTDYLTEIVLDKGRRPHCWVNGKRIFLSGPDNGDSEPDEGAHIVDETDIQTVLQGLGDFGSDNRAGLERQLHRISCIRNRDGKITGLTLRVGRHVDGNTAMISDLLFRHEGSVLFLGEPGTGKTTIVREATRQLAEKHNVCVVDTSNEIGGDGDIPHRCTGHARRMMVRTLNEQANVMVECVQNHTPSVMVIDEIGRSTEVEAARTCKQRGVRMIASAHGDLRMLVKNPKLRGLIGGLETTTLGDAEAKAEQMRKGLPTLQKSKTARAGPPVFDIVVELQRGMHHDWHIVLDAAKAVDTILEGNEYVAQLRQRNPDDGSFGVTYVLR